MISAETIQYFNINRVLLLIIGLWPYQRSKLAHFQAILYFAFLVSSIIFQIIIFISIKCTTDIMINIFCNVLYSVIYIITYNSFWINTHTVKYLLEQFQYIYNELKDENEITIIKRYENKTKRQTIILLSIILCGFLIFISRMNLPNIIDIDIVFTNGSQSCCARYTIIFEYFFNQKRYFLILLHTFLIFFVGAFMVTAIGSMLMAYMKYICGMFRIASYRIEQAMMINMFENISLKKEIGIEKRIICGIDIHRKAMKFSKFLISTFEGMLLALIFFTVICLSFNLFGMFRYAVGNNVEKFFIHSMMVFIILLYMFLGNSTGQDIIDHNNDVFSAAYNIQWYIAPLRIQKLILFLLQRGNATFNINIAGVFTGSLQCFATLTKQSISYFTVIYSTQQ